MLTAPNLNSLDWLIHGFGFRDSKYPENVTSLHQIHSDIVVAAVKPGGDRIAEGDALISRECGLMVGIRTADCVPVLIADERTQAVACIHAGWRGTSQNIVNKAVRALITHWGVRAEDLHAAIGPAIGPCCYRVGSEVARQFGTWRPELAQVAEPTHIDLAGINETQLKNAGVTNIWQAGECTVCNHTRYFSFRREKEQAGRMLSFIGRAQMGGRAENTPGGCSLEEIRPETLRR